MIASCCSARSARPAYQGPPPMREPRPSRTSRARGPITASGRTTGKRKRQGQRGGAGKAGEGAADRALPWVGVVDEMNPPGRPDRGEPLVETKAREPGDDLGGSHLRGAEGVAVARDPLCEQDAEERHEERAEQVEEGMVMDEIDHERAGGRDWRARQDD